MDAWGWTAKLCRCALVLLATCPLAASNAQCDNQWLFSPDQGDPGIPGEIFATIEWTMNTPTGPRQVLVASGKFSSAGQAFANSIAYWDGEWHPFGSGPSTNPLAFGTQTISALCIYQGELVAAGSFSEIGGVAAIGIARWNGSIWTPLGQGIDGTINTLCVIDDTLYVGGSFAHAGGIPAVNVAAWNGNAWSAPGGGLASSGGVQTLVEFQGQLRAGGSFTFAGLGTCGLATWNGSSWAGSPGIASITSLCSYNGSLYSTSGESLVRKWTGSAWQIVGSPGQQVSAQQLAVHAGKLIAAGKMTNNKNVPANSVAAWDGTTWSPVGDGIRKPQAAITFAFRTITSFGIKLVVAGNFASGAPGSCSIAQWDGAEWTAMGAGIGLPPPPFSDQTPSVFEFGEWNGDLVAGGVLASPEGEPTCVLSVRRENAWHPFGGFTNLNTPPHVGAILSFRGELVIGGDFDRSGQTPLSNIASWNGTQWSPLGLGMNGLVTDLAEFNGELIAAGGFTTAGGTPAKYVARWDGAAWHPLGAGANNVVYALAIYQGELIAAGMFTSLGEVEAAHIARWDGLRWAPLGSGIDGPKGLVGALTVHNGDLIAVGGFNSAGGASAGGVARWNGSSWTPLGLGSITGASALADFQGELFAAALLPSNPPQPNYDLVKWTGSSWQRQSSGFNGRLHSLHAMGNELLIGGEFSRVNNRISVGWARYGGCAFCEADLNNDSLVNDADFAIFLAAYDPMVCADPSMPAGCPSDFNADGLVSDEDFAIFILAYDTHLCP
ncbi:MAG: hypothetical protein JNM86_08725 [Phycisphaerae bacterium]|nr:hypothetical protein [Phycisphaerae bacterium]